MRRPVPALHLRKLPFATGRENSRLGIVIARVTPMNHRTLKTAQRGARWIFAVVFTLAGLNHFHHPAFYRRIVPPVFPHPAALVAISGIFEIVGGLGLLFKPLRRIAAWGLIALLIAVFPANIYMTRHPQLTPQFSPWLLWARLPLQVIFIAIVWFSVFHRSNTQRR